jgi:hypothetical protein
VGRGVKPTVLLLAVDRDQAGVAFDRIEGLLDAVPEFAAQIESRTKASITLRTGVEIQIATADQASVRGRVIVAAVLDEFAFWAESDAVEVPRALRPGMLTQPGAKLIVITSIYASYGPAFEIFRTWGEPDSRQLVIKGTTFDFHSSVDRAEIDQALAEDPIGASAEYLTIPRSDVARFIDAALLDPLTRRSPRELPWTPVSANGAHFTYFAGIDASAGRGDATAVAVARQDGDKVVVCAVRHFPSPHDPQIIAHKVAEFLAEYKLTQATGDQYGSGITVALYRNANVDLLPTELSRSDTYLATLPLLTTGRIELPDDPTLRRELIGLERRTGRGKDVIDHPPHGHDDVVNALMIAAHCASRNVDAGPEEIHVAPSTFFDDGYVQPGGAYLKYPELSTLWSNK